MSSIYISNITIEKVRHLHNIKIPLGDIGTKHLILTGKNGSGKTSVLDAVSKYIEGICSTNTLYNAEKYLAMDMNNLKTHKELHEQKEIEKRIDGYRANIKNIKNGLDITFNKEVYDIKDLYDKGEFLIAYYKSDRNFHAVVPKHIEKIQFSKTYKITEIPRENFVKYLLDMKMSEALAVSSKKVDKSQEINCWFEKFDNLLKQIFNDDSVELMFDEETFEFHIRQQGKELFDFNTLSSGYSAILDIVIDIILRMTHKTGRKFQFNMAGIVLIDEIENHLHLEMQRTILPFLTVMFPNVQYIISTHSPFILNSIDNAIIFDLEKEILVSEGLTNVPYEGIVEGYFESNKLSSELVEKYNRYKKLIEKKELSDDDINEILHLQLYLDELPDYLALGFTTEYKKLKLEFEHREDV